MGTNGGVHEYHTELTWVGRSSGRVRSEGLPDLEIAPPPEFGGEAGSWTPEHLFVASAATCLMTTFLAIARLSRLEVSTWSASARGRLEKVEGTGWAFTAITIEARVGVLREEDVERARRLLAKAEDGCLIAHSMRCPVNVEAVVAAAAPAPLAAS